MLLQKCIAGPISFSLKDHTARKHRGFAVRRKSCALRFEHRCLMCGNERHRSFFATWSHRRPRKIWNFPSHQDTFLASTFFQIMLAVRSLRTYCVSRLRCCRLPSIFWQLRLSDVADVMPNDAAYKCQVSKNNDDSVEL
jgi:hypothetical protein